MKNKNITLFGTVP